MELDLRSFFGLLCTAVLIGCDPAIPPPAFGLIYDGSYCSAKIADISSWGIYRNFGGDVNRGQISVNESKHDF